MLAEFMTATYPTWPRPPTTGWSPPSPRCSPTPPARAGPRPRRPPAWNSRRPRSDRAARARARAIPAAELLAFLDADHPLREKTLWWLLYETAARAGEVGVQ